MAKKREEASPRTRRTGSAPSRGRRKVSSRKAKSRDATPSLDQITEAAFAKTASKTGVKETSAPATPPDYLPARMLNEFVYCPRLFWYEQVAGVFVHNADTERGATLHQRVDKGDGELKEPSESADAKQDFTSRSVTLASDRLGVIAKMDVVELQPPQDDLFAKREVQPVDYKAGAPRPGEARQEMWDTDRMQLGLQCLILRDNGYVCHRGFIYYRQTRQRVPLECTPELEAWVLDQLEEARRTAAGPLPRPLVNSPKCPRCSLAPVCLPDETNLLGRRIRPEPLDGTELPRLLVPRHETRALYLNTQGNYVGLTNHVLRVTQKKKVIDTIRLHDIHSIALFGNIQLSTQTIRALCEREIPIAYFSMGGWFYGITRSHELTNVFTRIAQFKAADDPGTCLNLARNFVQGKINNQRVLLMRDNALLPDSIRKKLAVAQQRTVKAPDIEHLLGLEGAAALMYFQHFHTKIKQTDPIADEAVESWSFSFNFSKRNRRPPRDPVNALLSLAYSLLSKNCVIAATVVGLDPYVGYFHQSRYGRPALALDIMEEFRALIADSAVLTAINNRMLTHKHFVHAGNAVNLTQRGRRIFFQVYERRLSQTLIHPFFGYRVTYRRAIELQFRLLAKFLTGEIADYQPLMTR